MKRLFALAIILLPACAPLPGGSGTSPAPVQVFSRSHNGSEVDVYLLCGNRQARWLGVVSEKGGAAFQVMAGETRCFRGLNFFLVVRKSGWGYWVGPVRPRAGGEIDLVIEKYAGLSTARLRNTGW